MGKYSVFCSYTNTILKICPFSKYIRANLRKFVSCPLSPDNQTPMNAPPPPNQKNYFSRYFPKCPPPNLQMSSKPLKSASFSPKSPNQKILKSTISNKSESAQNSILAIFTWPVLCPNPLKTLFVVPK